VLAALAAEAKGGFGRYRITRLVKQLLAITGFDPVDIDGLVGPKPRAAIPAFVQAQGGSPTDAVEQGSFMLSWPPQRRCAMARAWINGIAGVQL
jgi:peptidoglycan hydrolase-like protein with peptidoglycan-binding domain